MINFTDEQGPGNLGFFDSEIDFGTDTPAADDSFLMLARCTVNVATAGNYTFGIRGDDGCRLRVVGRRFTSSTRLLGTNNADPGNVGDAIVFSGTGDGAVLGVVNLPAGDHDLELTWFENNGGSAIEVFSAPGSKTSVDSTFKLIGNPAAGGLPIVRDSDTVPTFTVEGGPSLFVHSGSPSTMTLAWNVNEPTTVLSIDQGIGAVAQNGSTTIPTPATTTTYTITATTGSDVITRSVTVYVNAAPVIPSFTASDETVLPGAGVVLTWSVQGATSLTLNPGNINVTGLTTRTVNPTGLTTYTLTATNIVGSTSATVTITTGAAPVITSYSASDLQPVYGKETTLQWTTTGATSASVNQGVGPVSLNGSVNVVPLVTTTYTFTATNTFGSSNASVTITLPIPIGIDANGFTARRVSSTVAFPFSGQGYLQSALSLLAGQNAGTTTLGSAYTTVNFADGADGDYNTGNNGFPGGSGDNFAMEVTGTLVVNSPGEYTFMVNSDDGCRLRIDGKDVIVDDATHNPSTSSGSISITKPQVSFQLIHYDATGGASVEVSWVRPNQPWQQLTTATPSAPMVRGSVVINEFAASGSSLLDEDFTTQDWIEIWNSTSSPVNLAGYYLTNSSTVPNVWAFPSKTLAPNEYLVVYASGKNRTNAATNLHTSFTLPGGGGYLALTKADGMGGYITLTEFNPYPSQVSGLSYGASGGAGALGFFEVPTPGNPNATSYAGFISKVNFSQTRGRYNAPFDLTLTSSTPGAEIRYTVDGSEPSWSRGTLYTGPVNISSTSTIRANAFLTGWKSPDPVTHSYIFLDDVVNQSTSHAVGRGWPDTAVNGQVYRYGMNLTVVTNGGGDVNALKSALSAAPSVILNLNPADFHGVTNGIYSNPGRRGRFWEREASLEIIKPDGTSAVQQDCGVRIRGNASRGGSNPKHAFHLYFRGLYGGDLNYPIFGNEGVVTKFDQIDMRCEQNNSWSSSNSGNNALMREEFARKTQGDMGQPYSRNGYFHLYINGVYWGIYNWQEKTEADFAASLFGGDDTDYDTVKSGGGSVGYVTEMTDGNELAWRQLFDLCLTLKNAASESARTAVYMQMQGLNPDGTRNTSYPILLDVNNLVDEQISMFYDGSFDAPMSTFLSNASNNWFGFRRRDGTAGGFKFFNHDHEHGMGSGNQSYNRVGPWGDPTATGNNWGQTWTTGQYRTRETFNRFNPHYLHEFLCFSAEYRQRFSDRAHKHLTGSGALTQVAAVARADALAAQIDPIIHAEAARWGSATLTKNTWLNTGKAGVYSFINTGGPSVAGQTTWPAQARNLIVIEQLKGYTDNGAKPLYINVADPVVSGTSGALVSNPYNFTITRPSSSGTMYYTLNGPDPRAIGGGVHAAALTGTSPISINITETTTVRARIYDSGTSQWSGLVENTYLIATLPSSANLTISELHYNPPTAQGAAEFIEIMNISSDYVLTGGTKFINGVTFTFPSNTTLAPGERCLLVENQATFTTQYPAVPLAQIAGTYAGSLNNGGERLTYVDASNAVIKDFSYGDSSPWPSEPDGNGPSLVLINPRSNPNLSQAANWRSSRGNYGTPLGEDNTSISDWFVTHGITETSGLSDSDNDGLEDLLEYALDLNPNLRDETATNFGTVTIGLQNYITITFLRGIGHDDLIYSPEASSALGSWAPAVLVSRTPNFSNGTEALTYRHPNPASADERQFLRLRVTRQP